MANGLLVAGAEQLGQFVGVGITVAGLTGSQHSRGHCGQVNNCVLAGGGEVLVCLAAGPTYHVTAVEADRHCRGLAYYTHFVLAQHTFSLDQLCRDDVSREPIHHLFPPPTAHSLGMADGPPTHRAVVLRTGGQPGQQTGPAHNVGTRQQLGLREEVVTHTALRVHVTGAGLGCCHRDHWKITHLFTFLVVCQIVNFIKPSNSLCGQLSHY